MLDLQAHQTVPKPDPEKQALEAELSEVLHKQNNLLAALENGSSARLVQRLQDLEQQESTIRVRLSTIPDPPVPPRFTRDELEFMLSQFQRDESEQTLSYQRRLLDTFVSSVTLSDEQAVVCFNLTAPGTHSPERLTVPFSTNKNPAEPSDLTPDSAGSTALRLVEAMGVEPMSEKSSV